MLNLQNNAEIYKIFMIENARRVHELINAYRGYCKDENSLEGVEKLLKQLVDGFNGFLTVQGIRDVDDVSLPRYAIDHYIMNNGPTDLEFLKVVRDVHLSFRNDNPEKKLLSHVCGYSNSNREIDFTRALEVAKIFIDSLGSSKSILDDFNRLTAKALSLPDTEYNHLDQYVLPGHPDEEYVKPGQEPEDKAFLRFYEIREQQADKSYEYNPKYFRQTIHYRALKRFYEGVPEKHHKPAGVFINKDKDIVEGLLHSLWENNPHLFVAPNESSLNIKEAYDIKDIENIDKDTIEYLRKYFSTLNNRQKIWLPSNISKLLRTQLEQDNKPESKATVNVATTIPHGHENNPDQDTKILEKLNKMHHLWQNFNFVDEGCEARFQRFEQQAIKEADKPFSGTFAIDGGVASDAEYSDTSESSEQQDDLSDARAKKRCIAKMAEIEASMSTHTSQAASSQLTSTPYEVTYILSNEWDGDVLSNQIVTQTPTFFPFQAAYAQPTNNNHMVYGGLYREQAPASYAQVTPKPAGPNYWAQAVGGYRQPVGYPQQFGYAQPTMGGWGLF